MRHSQASRTPMRTGVLIAAVLLLLAGACGGGDDSGDEPTATASSTAQPESYTVVAGDTLASIAGRLGLSVAELVVANGIADPDLIEVGQVLVVPGDDPLSAAGMPPAPLTCAEHRSLLEEVLAAAALIDEASTLGAGIQYDPYLDEIDRVSGLLVRRSESSGVALDTLLRVLARLAIDTTRLSRGQVTAVEAGIGETTAELSVAADTVIANVCATSSPAEPAPPTRDTDDGRIHPSDETGVA